MPLNSSAVPMPSIPGAWFRHRTNDDRCVVVIRCVPAGVMVRNERGRVEVIEADEWLRSFYPSRGGR